MTNPPEKRICSRCVYDNFYVKNIVFDDAGVCNYCRQIEDMKAKYQTGLPDGERMFEVIVDRIKAAGRNKPYDCVMGVSGGTDSSYMAYLAVEKYGLRPLAVHLDNTFNNKIATDNIHKVLGALKIDLVTHVVGTREAEDIYRAFFEASVIDFDVFADIGVPQLLYRTAAKYGLKYQLEGHSYIAEGISPLGTMYADGKYLRSVHARFGSVPLKTFPNMSLLDFLKWTTVYRIEKIRPLWYVKYTKEDARTLLKERFNWTYYDGHHLENRTGAFQHSVLGPQKFGLDSRANSLSASVRSGKIAREDALRELAQPPVVEEGLVEYMQKRMRVTPQEYADIMARPVQTFMDYPTYKKDFERLRPLFWVLLRAGLIPESFYIKYCFPFKRAATA
jgi:N-acetyl sugar amidotransferase